MGSRGSGAASTQLCQPAPREDLTPAREPGFQKLKIQVFTWSLLMYSEVNT